MSTHRQLAFRTAIFLMLTLCVAVALAPCSIQTSSQCGTTYTSAVLDCSHSDGGDPPAYVHCTSYKFQHTSVIVHGCDRDEPEGFDGCTAMFKKMYPQIQEYCCYEGSCATFACGDPQDDEDQGFCWTSSLTGDQCP